MNFDDVCEYCGSEKLEVIGRFCGRAISTISGWKNANIPYEAQQEIQCITEGELIAALPDKIINSKRIKELKMRNKQRMNQERQALIRVKPGYM